MVLAWKGMLVCAIATALGACGSFPPPYPANMPPLASSGDGPRFSPDISGAYLDRGRVVAIGGAPRGNASLSKMLDPAGGHSGSAHAVVLRGAKNATMEIELLRRDGTSIRVIRKHLAVEPYEKHRSNGTPCRDGLIPFHIESHVSALAPLPVGLYEGSELWLSKAADGSLILLRYGSIGWWVVVPWWDTEVLWHAFPPATGAPSDE